MSKKKALISIILTTIFGSIIAFYGTNLILSDVSNMFYMSITKDVISSIPIFMVALEFTLLAIGIIRVYRYPEYKKSETYLYAKITFVFSVIGAVSAIITGLTIYPSFFSPYPFKLAVILTLVWHIMLIVLLIYQMGKIKKQDLELKKRKMSLRHILYTIFLSVLVFYSFNRFGAILLMPTYVQVRTLDITILFYISLLLPLGNLIHALIHVFDFDVKHKKLSLRYAIIQIVLCVILAAYVFFIGMKNTLFISAISPAVAIERLLTMPIDTMIHFGLTFVLDLYSLYIVLRHKKERNL